MYKYRNLTKKQFLEANKEILLEQIDIVNDELEEKYSGNETEITQMDFWVLLNCEAGLKNGIIDPQHRHSAQERGLFPLPSNVRYWNGSDAPEWNKPMPLDVNIKHFMLYLGNLKNKVVTIRHGFVIYSGFFEVDGISDNPVRAARLLAGVVHGYFRGATYKDKIAPYEQLLKGYIDEVSLHEMMNNTKYIHAGKELMKNREANIEEALSWL